MTSAAENSAPKVASLTLASFDVTRASPKEALLRLTAEWDKAEELMKLAERLRAEVVQPSVNELRYAGRRLVDAWKLSDVDDASSRKEFDAFVSDAIFRCHCAQHDAIDASVLFVQRTLVEYEAEFGPALLIQHFPSVADLRASLAEADELIVSSRSDRAKRALEYDRLATTHLPTIVTVYRAISSNRTVLEALVADKQRLEGRDSNRFRASLWITGAVAVVAALVGAVATVEFEHLSAEPVAPTSLISSPTPGTVKPRPSYSPETPANSVNKTGAHATPRLGKPTS